MVARTWIGARSFFAAYEGMDPNEVEVDRICALPAEVEVGEAGWADAAVLRGCGAEILRPESPRVARIRGIVYEEGRMDYILSRRADDLFELRGQGRPNGTPSLSTN